MIMSMVLQPPGCRRVKIGTTRPAPAHEIWSGSIVAGITVRRTTGGRTTGWLAVPTADAEPSQFARHTDAMDWLDSL
jgi:hypothetical protein